MPIQVTRQPDYRDLDLSFEAHPVTGDVSKKVGAEALKRSVKTLVLTNFYERKFRHSIGSNATRMLFENVNPITATFLQNAIAEVIRNFEPRVTLLDVLVSVDADGNGYNAAVVFQVNNIAYPITTQFFLERIR
jgi:phage baseplate assembly protein W